MSDNERLTRLEQRVAVLESLIRDVLSAPTLRAESPMEPRRPVAEPLPPRLEPATPVRPVVRPEPAIPHSPRPVRIAQPTTRFLSEEWLGQRGLLAVGVVFVVLSAGYLLKLSFDRGWVSPMMRCIGGALAGVGVGALGWRLHGKGVRTYGAALIGTGAAIVYLAVWAAARLYQFVQPTPAVAALALVAVGLAAVAWAINVEALGAAAALGAFFAPLLIGQEAGSVNMLLFYLGSMGAGLGAVSVKREWRIATFLVALSYFGTATSGALARAHPAGLYLYAIAGGAAGLWVGLKHGWFETRFLGFVGGWGVLSVADERAGTPWITLLGGLLLTAPVWWRALRFPVVWPDRSAEGKWGFGDSLYFYLSPILVAVTLPQLAPDTFRDHQGLAPALIALPYLAAGFTAPRRPFAVVGVAAITIAALVEWNGLQGVWALLALTHIFAFADHALNRRDGATYAMTTFTVALLLLLSRLSGRAGSDAAFIGPWALTLWLTVATTVALAVGLLTQRQAGPSLWVLAGILLLLGVTGELVRFFDRGDFSRATAELAGGLSVSAWWILFAAGCFLVGFRRGLKPLRLAGFVVAGLALGKVVLVDLSTLDAFYRIGSALILGIVSLAVAYAYHKGMVVKSEGR